MPMKLVCGKKNFTVEVKDKCRDRMKRALVEILDIENIVVIELEGYEIGNAFYYIRMAVSGSLKAISKPLSIFNIDQTLLTEPYTYTTNSATKTICNLCDRQFVVYTNFKKLDKTIVRKTDLSDKLEVLRHHLLHDIYIKCSAKEAFKVQSSPLHVKLLSAMNGQLFTGPILKASIEKINDDRSTEIMRELLEGVKLTKRERKLLGL